MRKLRLLSEQIDLIEGRVGRTIFLMHYFKENPNALSANTLELLPKLESNLIITKNQGLDKNY
jgi:hypothetical protein